jgi:hypothetical protein
MSRRPFNHVVADRALNDVTKIWLELGCACDRVVSDYGEDLVVQPAWHGRVDPFRIFVQVKGTTSLERYQRKSARHTFPIEPEAMYKWARSNDLTVMRAQPSDPSWDGATDVKRRRCASLSDRPDRSDEREEW